MLLLPLGGKLYMFSSIQSLGRNVVVWCKYSRVEEEQKVNGNLVVTKICGLCILLLEKGEGALMAVQHVQEQSDDIHPA
jgi:hypothetical protein